eukprot:2455922-Pyramimonas_sp.AAC.1
MRTALRCSRSPPSYRFSVSERAICSQSTPSRISTDKRGIRPLCAALSHLQAGYPQTGEDYKGLQMQELKARGMERRVCEMHAPLSSSMHGEAGL